MTPFQTAMFRSVFLGEDKVAGSTELIGKIASSRFFFRADSFEETADGMLRISGYGLTQTTEDNVNDRYIGRYIIETAEESDQCVSDETLLDEMEQDEYVFSRYDTQWTLWVTNTDYVLVNCREIGGTSEAVSSVLTSQFVDILDEYIKNDERFGE